MAGLEPWERQEGESVPAFEAFQLYRDMGVKRSAGRVAKECGKNRSLIERWCTRHGWVDRAAAWDREQDRLWRLEQAEARREVARKHARVGAAMLSKAVQRLQSIDPNKLTPTELERWMRTAAELERTAVGGSEDQDAAQQAAGVITELVKSLRR